jgi:hypothetical protein
MRLPPPLPCTITVSRICGNGAWHHTYLLVEDHVERMNAVQIFQAVSPANLVCIKEAWLYGQPLQGSHRLIRNSQEYARISFCL